MQKTQPKAHVEDSFHQHATRAVSLMCVAIGCVSVVVPLFYHVNPWTGVVFTALSYWAYRQSSREDGHRAAAITIVTILTLSSLAFAAFHGLYGALGFFLLLLSALVASLTLSQRIGLGIFVFEIIVTLPLAIHQYALRELYDTTPVLPDALMAILIAGVFYAIIRMFSYQLTTLKGREHAHLKELKVYNTQIEKVLQTRLEELENQINDRTNRMRQLAQRGKELSHLTHDLSNTLTTLRLVLDQNLHTFTEKDRSQIESSFEYLRTILQDSQKGSQGGKEVSSVLSTTQNSLKLMEKTFKREHITVRLDVEDFVLQVQPSHLQRIIGNLLQNSYDALKESNRHKKEIRISGKWIKRSYILSIEDNGPGIAEHLLPLITEPWFSTKGNNHMGMGLSSVQELLKPYNATFNLESKVNHSTRVTLKFPV